MKRLSVICLLLTLCLLAACGAAPESGEEADFILTACLGPEPDGLDPQAGGRDRDTYSLQLFEGLLKYAPTDRPAGDTADLLAAEAVCGQAASWEVSEDGLTYSFRLRDDIYWSDGTPVTAGDFVCAWRQLVEPERNCPSGQELAGTVAGAAEILAGDAEPETLGVSAPDQRTFVVELVQPRPDFPQLCARPGLSPLPAAAVAAYGDDWATAEHLLSNGPFRLDLWVEDFFITLVPQENYYDADKVSPAGITFYFAETEAGVLEQYLSGHSDFIQGFPNEAAADLIASGDCRRLALPGQCLLSFSCRSLPDWRVRAALALAVDTDKLCGEILQGGQAPATGLVDAGAMLSDGSSWRERQLDVLTAGLCAAYPDADLSSQAGRCALAARLLAEAEADGFTAAAPLRLIYLQDGDESGAAAATVTSVAADISSALGIELALLPLDQAAFDQALAAGDFDLALLAWHTRQAEDGFYLNMFTSASPYNYGGWSSPAYDALLQAGAEAEESLLQAEAQLFRPGAFPCRPLYGFGCQYCQRGLTGAAWSPDAGFSFVSARPLAQPTEE